MDHRNTLVAPARADRALALGRYRLRERLGSGGFGVVWSAHDELLHREVAVKRISLPTEEDRERATREALACARLSHPAIVALYEACADEQDFFLISELVQGQTLAGAIADDVLSDAELLEVGVVLCDALAHAHARGVIHRDVKPHNILLPDRAAARGEADAAAIAKLTDFGGARLSGEDALTRTGDVLGTLAYMAPEQCEGFEAGAAADLYSLALVLYEALSGVNPVRGPTPAATARRIGSDLPALERHRRDLPRPLTRAVDVALAADPRDREDLEDLREACAEALADGRTRDRGPARARALARAPRALRDSPTALRASRGAPRTPRAGGAGIRAVEDAAGFAGHAQVAPVAEPASEETGWLTLQRLACLLGVLALVAWQLVAGRAGVALLALCAALPVVVLVRRPGPRWLSAGIAPLLGVIGLAGAFPALAGQATAWRTRVLLGALGYWWLRLSEPLLDTATRRLWLGAPAGTAGGLPNLAWERSLTGAAVHALAPLLTLSLLFGALSWALAAALLPLLVRGGSALRDALGATVWAVALAAGTPLVLGLSGRLTGAASHATAPRGVVSGAACGALLAVGARAAGTRGGRRRGADAHGALPRVDGRVG